MGDLAVDNEIPLLLILFYLGRETARRVRTSGRCLFWGQPGRSAAGCVRAGRELRAGARAA